MLFKRENFVIYRNNKYLPIIFFSYRIFWYLLFIYELYKTLVYSYIILSDRNLKMYFLTVIVFINFNELLEHGSESFFKKNNSTLLSNEKNKYKSEIFNSTGNLIDRYLFLF